MIGKTILQYKILEKLGQGGMGVVYKAEDTKLDRHVALKFLPLEVGASGQEKVRFIQEAKAAAALSHPNVCSVFDVQEHDGEMFIVMEFIEGQTLKDKLKGLNFRQAVEIGIQIADGLAAAHESGVVHRDIKPENIMVRRDGIVQITDFGLAKLRGVSRLTKEGTTVGTAGYMSPEQLQGHDVDRRSDIFSLGVVLYEMFTGERPFKGAHDAALMYEIISVDPPQLSSLKPGIDPDISRIVMECLQKDPADRYQSAAEVAKELRKIKRGSERFSAPQLRKPDAGKRESTDHAGLAVPGNRGRVRPAQVAGAVVVVGIIALLIWRPWITTAVPLQPVGRFVVPFPPGTSLELERDGLALSPDGRHLALILRGDSSAQLYLRDIDNFGMRPLAATAGLDVSRPFFSPDGQWLGFFANGKIMKLSLSGGSPVTICDALPGQASWGEEKTIVFMQRWGSHLWIVSSEPGSVPRPLTKLDVDAGERAHLLPWVLPGGRKALFTIWRGGALEDMVVAGVDLTTGEHSVVLTNGSMPSYLTTGQLVFMRGSTLMAALFDAKNVRVIGEAHPVLEKVLTDGSNAHAMYGVSDNGTLVYAQGEVEFGPSSIYLLEHGTKSREIAVRDGSIGYPRFSPDGTRLSVEIPGVLYQVGIYDLRRSVLTRVTFNGDNLAGVWLPDGSQITCLSNLDGKYEIYTIAADGSGMPQRLLDQPLTPPPPPHPFCWSPDAKYLAFVTFRNETGADISLFSRVDTPATRLLIATRANESNPSFSPDGRWISYVSDETGENEVFVQPFPPTGGRWRISTSGGKAPVWGRDGHSIFFQRNDEVISVRVTTTMGKNGATLVVGNEELFLSRPGLISFDLSPDGRTIAVSQTRTKDFADHVNVVVNWPEELKRQIAARGGDAASRE